MSRRRAWGVTMNDLYRDATQSHVKQAIARALANVDAILSTGSVAEPIDGYGHQLPWSPATQKALAAQ